MTDETAISALRARFGDRIQTAAAVLGQHGRSEAWFPETPPDAVLLPASTAEVADAVRICADHRLPVTAWGAGTSLEGHALPVRGGLSLDFSAMNRVLQVNAADLDCVVQPGLTREGLNTDLRATGLFFPVDPGANASLGGMAATRCSGTTAVRYGTMRDNVLALECVLADGRVIRTGTRARKSSAGYDLTRLIVGSEGTLALITELTLRLQGIPEAVLAATCRFPAIGPAVDCVIETIQTGVPMARIEFLDEVSVRGFNRHFGTAFPEQPHLFVEFHGSAAGVAEQSDTFLAIAAGHGAEGFDRATTPEDRTRLWKMRHNAYYAQKALRPGCNGMATDICVPISALAQAITETRADIDASGMVAPMLGHVGDGNFHAAIMIEPGNATELAQAKALAHRMAERALHLGGTVTGEHGVGMGKLGLMQAEHGAAWGVMGTVKQALDPLNILNPGKVVQVN
jgi:D-lactate dehydrogenase (cytochrome)